MPPQLHRFRARLIGRDPGFLRWYYRHLWQPKPHSLAAILDQESRNNKSFRFLQIGGNDGFVHDPIFPFVKRRGWQGIIVEPQRAVFQDLLSQTYRNEPGVMLENVAIADRDGTMDLFKLSFSEARWATGLATFHRPTLEHQIDRGYVAAKASKHGVVLPARREDFLTVEKVPCLTVSSLLRKHQISHLNLLQLDTEGYDWEILQTIDLAALQPDMIGFEREHLSPSDRAACEETLRAAGYELHLRDRDGLAVKRS